MVYYVQYFIIMIQKSVSLSNIKKEQENIYLLIAACAIHLLMFSVWLMKILSSNYPKNKKNNQHSDHIYDQATSQPYHLIITQLLLYYILIEFSFILKSPNTFRPLQLISQLTLIIFGHVYGVMVIAANSFKINELSYQHKSQKINKLMKKQSIKLIIFIVLFCLACIWDYNWYFPKKFNIGVNMIGLLLTHTFTRYVLLNQILLFLCPLLAILILVFVPSSPHLKLTMCYFFSIYCSCSLNMENQSISLFGLFLMEGWAFKQIVNQLNQKYEKQAKQKDKIKEQLTILNILLIVSWGVSVVGYFIFSYFSWLYLHTHIAGVSYLIVGQLVFWIAHAQFLSESLTIEQNLSQQDKTKKKFGGILYWFLKQIKNM